VNLVTSESPAAWPRDVRFTVHASIGMIAGKCNLIRHLSSILATPTSVVFELMAIRISPKGQELHEIQLAAAVRSLLHIRHWLGRVPGDGRRDATERWLPPRL